MTRYQGFTLPNVMVAYTNQKKGKTPVPRVFSGFFEGTEPNGERVSDLSYADIMQGKYSRPAFVLAVAIGSDWARYGRDKHRPIPFGKFGMDEAYSIGELAKLLKTERVPISVTDHAVATDVGEKKDKFTWRNASSSVLTEISRCVSEEPDYRAKIYCIGAAVLNQLAEDYEHFGEIIDITKGAKPGEATENDVETLYTISELLDSILRDEEPAEGLLVSARYELVPAKSDVLSGMPKNYDTVRRLLLENDENTIGKVFSNLKELDMTLEMAHMLDAVIDHVPDFLCPREAPPGMSKKEAGFAEIVGMVRRGELPLTEREKQKLPTKAELKQLSKIQREGLATCVENAIARIGRDLESLKKGQSVLGPLM